MTEGSHSVISRVKPELTGLWQVRGRNVLPFKERLVLDEYYVRNWSLWLDIVIFIKTIKVLITREGAY
ncbi:MAG: sugar transferase [Candidatus Aminicenantia bacterium]